MATLLDLGFAEAVEVQKLCQFGVKYCPNPSNGFHTLEDCC